MKNIKVITRIICLILVILITTNLNTYATNTIIEGADKFLDSGTDVILNKDAVESVLDKLFDVFLAVGTIIVVIVGALLGLKFVMGSTSEKAEVKETLIPFAIGSIVIFGAIGIWKLVSLILDSVF